MAEPRQKARGSDTGDVNGGLAAPNASFRLWIIGVGVVAVVIILVIFTLTQTRTGNPSSPPTSGGTTGQSIATPGGGAKPTAAIVSSHVPELVSPADNDSVDSLNSQVTFAWQRVIDAPATYNIEFQYSEDGNNWGHSEIIYGWNNISYVRTNPFLSYKYVRWRVWATTNNGDSDTSNWWQLVLPVQ